MNNIISILIVFLLVSFISGCTSVPIPKVVKYSIDTPVTENKKIKNINISIQRVRGRTQFDKKNLSVSPVQYVMESYSTAQWAESPCSMLTDDIIAYLSKKFNYVTSSSLNYNNSIDYTISVYIDDLKHIRRNDKWFAVLTLHYEIISAKTKKVVINKWFREKIELGDSSVQTYVNIQNKSVDKFLQQLTSEIAGL